LAVLQAFVDQGKLKWSFRTNPLVQNPVTDAMGDSERWELMYTALVRYGEENSHCNVPHHIGFTLDEGGDNGPTSLVRLGFWLGTQRKYKKAGKLKPEYEARLQELVNEGKLKWSMRSKAAKKKNFYPGAPQSLSSSLPAAHSNTAQIHNHSQPHTHHHQQVQQPTSSMVLNMQQPIHGLMTPAMSSHMQAHLQSQMQAAQVQLLQQAQLHSQTTQAYIHMQHAQLQEHQQRLQQHQQYQMQHLQQQQQQQQQHQQMHHQHYQQHQLKQQLQQHIQQQQHMHQQQMQHPSARALQRQAELQQSYLHTQIQAQIQAQLQAQMKAQMQAAQMHLPPGNMQQSHTQQQQMILGHAAHDLLRQQHVQPIPQNNNVMIDDDGNVII